MDLSGQCLMNIVLEGAVLINCDLRSADLSGANLTNASVKNAQLRCAIYTERTRWPNNYDYTTQVMIGHNSDLSGQDNPGLDILEKDLSNAKLLGTYSSNSNLSGTRRTGADCTTQILSAPI